MTNMQLAYTEYLENARHNRAQEETNFADVAEKVRSHKVSEELTRADQDLRRYINDTSLLTSKQLQQMKSATDLRLQEMRNEISSQEIALKKQEINNAWQKYQADINKINADTTLTQEKTKTEKQKRQGDLKTKIRAVIGNAIEVGQANETEKSGPVIAAKVAKVLPSAGVQEAKSFVKSKVLRGTSTVGQQH